MENRREYTQKVNGKIATMQDRDRLVAAWFGMWQGILVSFVSLIAPWAVPIAPAIFAGWAFYQIAVEAKMSTDLALASSVALVIGLETVGAGAAHTTLQLYNAWQRKQVDLLRVVFSGCLIIVYAGAGITIICLLETSSITLKAIGIGSFILALVSYAAQMLAADVRRITVASQIEKDEEQQTAKSKERLREERIKLELELDREKAKLELEMAKQSHTLALEQKQKNSELTRTLRKDKAKAKLPEVTGKTGKQGQKLPEENTGLPVTPSNGNGTETTLPEWLPTLPESLSDFRDMVSAGTIVIPDTATGPELSEVINKSARTGQLWLEAGREIQNGPQNGNQQ
jgi:hypothetical protein